MFRMLFIFLICWGIVVGVYKWFVSATTKERLTIFANSFKLILSALVAAVLFVVVYFVGNLN